MNWRLFKRIGSRYVVQLNLQWDSHSFFVGLIWHLSDAGLFHLYLVILPMFPLHLAVMRRKP